MKKGAQGLGVALLLALIAALLLRGRQQAMPGVVVSAHAGAGDQAAAAPEAATRTPIAATSAAVPEPDAPAPEATAHGGLTPGGLAWLLKNQNPDGSWGRGRETFEGREYSEQAATALALLAWLGAGYTHLSKETHDGLVVGEAVKRGLKWLLANPPEDPLGKALVSLALAEAYGMTSSPVLKPGAEAAMQELVKLQTDSGSWGDDPSLDAWAAEAIASARISGLELPEGVEARAAEAFAARLRAQPDATTATAFLFTSRGRTDEALAAAKTALEGALPNWSSPDWGYWYLGSLAMFQLESGKGDGLRRWGDALKVALTTCPIPEGGWVGVGGPTAGTVRNALGSLSLEVFYRYATVFESSKKK